MALKSWFLDNEVYGADDVNAITARLVTNGVGFADGKSYNLNTINDLTKECLLSRGVAYADDTALRVEKSGTAYIIKPGTCFFGNGSVTEVTEAETVSAAAGDYIYMRSDFDNANANIVVVSQTAPSTADTNIVTLAHIEDDGSVTDMRFYAQGKLRYEQPAVTRAELEITASDWAAREKTIDPGVSALSLFGVYGGSGQFGGMMFFKNSERDYIRWGSTATYFDGGSGAGDGIPASYYCIITGITHISGTTWKLTLQTSTATDRSNTAACTMFYC